MKKILSAIVLISFLAVLAAPGIVLADKTPIDSCMIKHKQVGNVMSDCKGSKAVPYTVGSSGYDVNTDKWGLCCTLEAVYTVTDWIFIGIMAAVIILVLFGAINILTAAGAPEKVAKGRDYIIYALIGSAIALLAKAFPALVSALLSTT